MSDVSAKETTSVAMSDDPIVEMACTCVLMRTRMISRVITAIHDEQLRPFAIGSPQFVLLVVIATIQPATRAEIGRFHHQDRSTLTRNLKVILAEGWVEEIEGEDGGRGRPIVLTKAGTTLLRRAAPAWRAAQAKSKELLGKDGVAAVTAITDRLQLDPGS